MALLYSVSKENVWWLLQCRVQKGEECTDKLSSRDLEVSIIYHTWEKHKAVVMTEDLAIPKLTYSLQLLT